MFKSIIALGALSVVCAGTSAIATSYPATQPQCLNANDCVQVQPQVQKRRIVRQELPIAVATAPANNTAYLARVYEGPQAYGRVIKPVQQKFTIRNYYKP